MEGINETKPITEGTQVLPKWTAKDSVFCDLFQDPENLLELYRCLHPEDTAATVEDLGNVTLRNILVEAQYNDLGFTVRDRQVILLEAQSTWSENIVLRIFLYLSETLNTYFAEHECNLYGTKKPALLKPELYVLYTGSRKKHPEWIGLADTFFEGDDTFVDVKVRVLYGDGSVNGILNQYVAFTKVFDEQVQIYGRSQRAVEETIRICKEAGALREYLATHEREVIRIMTTLFSQEHARNVYIAEVREQARTEGEKRGRAEGEKRGRAEGEKRGRAEGEKKGRAEGQMVEKKNTAFRLKSMGYDNGIIAKILDVSLLILEEWFGEPSGTIA